MMAVLNKPGSDSRVYQYTLAQLPPFSKNTLTSLPCQVAAYFRRLMQQHPLCDTLILPGVVALAGHFRDSEKTVFEAFNQLRQERFEVVPDGMDGSVSFMDPVHRTTVALQHWQGLSDEMLDPWDVVKKRTRNPLHPLTQVGSL